MLNKLKKKFNQYLDFYGLKITLLIFLEKFLDKILKQRKVNHYLSANSVGNYVEIEPNWMNFELNSLQSVLMLFHSLFTRYPHLPDSQPLPPAKQGFKIEHIKEANILIIYDKSQTIPEAIQAKTITLKSLKANLTTKEILNFDAIFLYQVPWKFKLYQYLRYAHLNYIPSFYWLDTISDNKQIQSALSSTDFLLTSESKVYDYYSLKPSTGCHFVTDINDLLSIYYKKFFPKVSLVIFNSPEFHCQQSYQGEWELILEFSTYNQKILEVATGDLLIFLGDDCDIDANLITHHVINHAFDDCHVALAATQLEDTLNPHSFVNLINCNFSLKKNLLNSLASHSSLLELGYLLYKAGAKFKNIGNATSIYPANLLDKQITNINLLNQKYPEFPLVTRRWQVNIKETSKKIRILTYPWHISHQYELYKLPYEFTLITDLGSPPSRGWNLSHRPLRDNVRFGSIDDINIGDFDLAILHFDENVLNPELTNGVIPSDWGLTFKYFRQEIDLPKVAICHGTPQFYGQYNPNYQESNLMQDIEASKKHLVEYLGNILTITNSYQANQEWGFKRTKVIWHGFDPLEFPPTTYHQGILAPFDQSVTSRPHYRGLSIYKQVLQDFPLENFPSTLQIQEPPVVYLGNQYAQAKFRNYVDGIRDYSIFFNPTIRSPMPRLRGEAMMCGLVSVSLKNHDVDLFISNGVNGFYANEPLELREYLLFLVNHPEETKKIGQRSRELAMDVFNHDRYLKEWHNTIGSLI